MKPTFDRAAHFARSQGGRGQVPLYLIKNVFKFTSSENAVANQFLSNASNEMNKTTGWYEMFYRGYDPALGRMLQVDPLAGMYSSVSGYNFALNNPLLLNDPMGDRVESDLPDYIDLNAYDAGPTRFGPGSGNHWSDNLSTSSMFSFLDRALGSRSSFGGVWSYGQSYYFKNSDEGFAAGASYNNQHGTWGNTYYGAYQNTVAGYYALRTAGILLSPESIVTAIAIVQARQRSVLALDKSTLMASVDPEHAQQGGLDDSDAGTNYRWFDYTAETRAAIVTGIPFVVMHTRKGGTVYKETILITVMIQLPKSVAISSDNYEEREWVNPNEASRLTDQSIRTAHMMTAMTTRTTNEAGLQSIFERKFIGYLENQLSMRLPGIDLPGVPGARVISRQNIPKQYMGYATPFVP